MKNKIWKFFFPLISISFFFILWSIFAQLDKNRILPSISELINSFNSSSLKTLWQDLIASLQTLFPGLFIGISAGILVGLFTGSYFTFDLLVSPTLNFVRAMPPVALAPVFIVLFGIGYLSKITIISFGVFFPVWISTFQGVKNIPKYFITFCKDYKLNNVQKFMKIVIPYTLPYIISGIRISIATSLVMLFISEWIASSEGIGYRMAVAHTLSNMDDLLVGIIILGLISLLLDFIFVRTTNFLFPWIKK
jgi:ABC-type nitrate/sulfonate/bicarbonate transport system permease component